MLLLSIKIKNEIVKYSYLFINLTYIQFTAFLHNIEWDKAIMFITKLISLLLHIRVCN